MRDLTQTLSLRSRLSVGAIGVLFAATVVALFLADLKLRYDGAIEAAKKDTLNYAEVLAEHAALTFAGVDSALRGAEAIRQNGLHGAYPSPDAMNWALRHLVQTQPAIVAIGWTDADGNLLAHSYDQTPPLADIADLQHLIVQQDRDDVGFHITPPYRSAAGDRWLGAALRRLTNPDGSFAGVVTAPIDPSYFNRLYRSVDLGKGGSILLLHREGRILTREPLVEDALGKSFAAGPLLSEHLPKAESGSYETRSIVDRVARIASYKAVPGLPLVVLVTRARADVLAPWHHFVATFSPLIVLIVAGVLFGTLVLMRRTRDVAAKTTALAQTNARFDAALRSMSQGLCLFDAEQRLVICNDRFREIYGYPAELVRPGTPLKTMLNHLVARGVKQGEMTVDEYIDGLATKQRETFFNLDGRVISIVRTPTADGGWVATHEDVTEQKRSERLLAIKASELQLTSERFEAAINDMPQGLCVFDAEQRMVVANERFREIYGYPRDMLKAGTPIGTFVADLARRGIEPDMPLDKIAGLAPQRQHRSLRKVGERFISIQRQRTPDGGWVSTHEDITEQKHAEQMLAEKAAELERLNERFNVAISGMPQGLCLFDAEQRVVIANSRFGDIYGLPQDLIRPGLPVQTLILEIAERGFVPDDMSVDQFAELALERERQLLINMDGRTVAISRARTTDGGWIATHDDITEQKRAEQMLAKNAAALMRANERFETAINNMPQGVCVFDAEQRVVMSNTRYSELYRLDPEQIRPGTTTAQILDYRRRAGTHLEVAPELYVATNFKNPQETQELADGRIMSISRRVMSDGGWLTTHEDITERAQSERRIAYLAQHDVLTGLANRAVFTDKLNEASKRHKRHGAGFTVLMLDLDRFKAVNDTLGHAAGDQLLIEVAGRLRASLRETDVLARLGGDEFAIIQDGEGDEQHHGAIIVARRIVDMIGKPFDLDGHLVNIGTSIGIAFAPEHGIEPEGLMKCADLALYATKAAGRNDFRVFGSEMAAAQPADASGVEAPPLAPSEPEPAPQAAGRSRALGR